MIKLYTDAATKGNPGPSAAGILVINKHIQTQFSQRLPILSNHEAEFAALEIGLQYLTTLADFDAIIQVNTDSRLVHTSLEKGYAKHYQSWVTRILALEAPFSHLYHQWLPEKQNQGAHHLAQQALNKS